MKKLLLLSAVGLFMSSCDLILKDRKDDEVEVSTDKKVVLGTDKDDKGCVTSAGYRWSQLEKDCIRAFEEGYRLNSIDALKEESTAQSAFVIFEEASDRAELFLPGATTSILLKKEGKDYRNGSWHLQADKGYSLKKSGQVLYAGAAIEEQQITGDDKQPEI